MTDTAKSSWITDHPFQPRLEPMLRWEPRGWAATGWRVPANPALCRVCHMAEAAHAETTSNSLSVNSDQEQPDGHTPAGP